MGTSTSFRDFVELCEKLKREDRRNVKINLVSNFLRDINYLDIDVAVTLLLGRPFPKWNPRTLDVSWVTLSSVIRKLSGVEDEKLLEAFNETGDLGDAAELLLKKTGFKMQTSLMSRKIDLSTIKKHFETIAELKGHGVKERKERILEVLMGSMEPLEVKYLVKIITGEMRTGFKEGLMEMTISRAFGIEYPIIRKAVMLLGDPGEVAYVAKTRGMEGVMALKFRFFRPIKPMLARNAIDMKEILDEHGGETSFEFKLDGARIQIHKLNDEVRIFSRRLTDVTESLPEIADLIRERITVRNAVLEGEVIAVGEDGNPLPFQHLMRRFRRVHKIEEMIKSIPIKLFLFDLIYLDDELLVEEPYIERRRRLCEICNGIPLTRQVITGDPEVAEDLLNKALAEGHEGLMAKKIDSAYTPGVRGKNWFKLKRTLEPLDLVIVAAEYGHGRRFKWLSDYYLAARDEESEELFIVGKTFKGLTDEEIICLTDSLSDLIYRRDGRRVYVEPKIVVEVLYNEIQRSRKYRSGVALRFARVSRIRYDKGVENADSIKKVREIFERQFEKKARYLP